MNEQKDFLQDALAQYQEVLARYRHKQLWEHVKGPVASIVLHVILIVLAIQLITTKLNKHQPGEIEVTMEEMEFKEIEPKLLEKLEELEQLAEEVVPTVMRPDISSDVNEEVVSSDDFEADMPGADVSVDITDVLNIKPTATALKIPSMFQGRTGKARDQQLRQYGGSRDTEDAVMRALRWLKKHQDANGSWSKTQADAMTGLALLAFLAHGETPTSEEFGMTVQKAMQFLANRMMESRAGLPNPYVNGIVTYALAEGYALTRLPFLKGAMEKGLDAIIRGQQPKTGGWDYNYAKGDRWDLSVAGWQMQAMKAGYVAGASNAGLSQAMDKSVDFVKNVTYKNGKFGYSSAGSGGAGMQGAGTLCLQLLGEGKSTEAQEGVRYIVENRAEKLAWKPDGHGFYNWYYETQAMFHAGRTPWRVWNKNFTPVLIKNQEKDGRWEAPTADSKKAPEYAPFYDTALACLSLQVYYRYLPTYKMPKSVAQKVETSIFDLDDNLGIEIQ